MFPAVSLGQELIRAVPTAEQLGSARRPVRVALDRSVDRSLTGRLPLAALAECDETRPFTAAAESEVAPGLRLTAEERSLAERVAQRTTGTLWCLVTGRDPDGVLVGQVVWLATDVGWIGLRPDPDGTGRELVALQAVARDDIGGWLAPYVAEILEVTDERS
jgi:hypothetical protein